MIPLYVKEGVAYVWNSEDWYTLRTKYRICGSLIGCAPSFPRQNDFLGLPMALMSEEAGLLVDKGLCELFELKSLTLKPSEEDKIAYNSYQESCLKEQREALKQKRIEQISQKIDIIVAGKKQKLLSQGKTNVQVDKQLMLKEEVEKLRDPSPAHLLVHLPTDHPYNAEKTKLSIEVLKPSIISEEGAIRYSIFKDLWDKNYYITTGSKFGSDYLLYPGDPVRFHAACMLRCIYGTNTFISPTNVVAFGRLAVAVNKIAVFAFCNKFGAVEYQSVQWHDSVNA